MVSFKTTLQPFERFSHVETHEYARKSTADTLEGSIESSRRAVRNLGMEAGVPRDEHRDSMIETRAVLHSA